MMGRSSIITARTARSSWRSRCWRRWMRWGKGREMGKYPCATEPGCGREHAEGSVLIMLPCPSHLKDHADRYVELVRKLTTTNAIQASGALVCTTVPCEPCERSWRRLLNYLGLDQEMP